jgi:hypothetical protein
MKKTVLLIFVLSLGLIGNFMFKGRHAAPTPVSTDAHKKGMTGTAADSDRSRPQFRCDGRMYCSQMTSCEEAKFFLQNCPGVKMDGDGDGIPCESQWCK